MDERRDAAGRRAAQHGRAGPRRPRPIDRARLERAALHHVAKYATTRQGLVDVLRRRVERWARLGDERPDDAATLIAAVAEQLVAALVIDDATFARGKVDALVARGRSSRRIAQTLRHQGVATDVAQAALADARARGAADGVDLELASARRFVARRRLGHHRSDEGERRERRQHDLAAVARQGFSFEIARRALAGDD